MAHTIPQVDVCIICALAEEADAVEHVVCEQCQVTFAASMTRDDHFVYRSTIIPNARGEPLTLALLCQMRPGPVSAALNVGTLLEKFGPCFVGMSGICAGDKRHTHLGDLVVAEYAYHFEEGKVTQDEQGEALHLPEGITYGPAPQVSQAVRTFEGWKTPVATLKQQMLGSRELPECVVTLMASGMAVRSDDPFPLLQRQHRKTWALDMEAASFYFALRATPIVDGLVVKGVVDYADLSKNDAIHDFAARASALYLLTFIQAYVTRDMHRREHRGAHPVFTVPYRRNPFFTGRGELLAQIHTHFEGRQEVALVLNGLGGIGKTQIVLEYAHRYRHEYQAVLWTRADTSAALVSGYKAIVEELKLHLEDDQDQIRIIQVVREWLATQKRWLLILDNADDLSLVSEFLPCRFDGHILLTTRAQATGGLARRIEVDTMPQDIGALFLLRRTFLLAADAPLEEAATTTSALARLICEELGGLPLALDQAGAYIEEVQCSLQDYQERYKTRRMQLLQRRGGLALDHPEPVATTWSLSFEKVEERSPVAAGLLRLCAFLHPDAIPVELIYFGMSHLDSSSADISKDDVALDEAIAILGAYSLLRRDSSERTLSIHRLVQAILQERMPPLEQAQWKKLAKRVLAISTEKLLSSNGIVGKDMHRAIYLSS